MNPNQDWTTVTFKKAPKNLPREIKHRMGDISGNQELKKIENETESTKIELIPQEIIKKVVQKRLELKKNQRDMAKLLQIPFFTYSEIENGKAHYSVTTKKTIEKIMKITPINNSALP